MATRGAEAFAALANEQSRETGSGQRYLIGIDPGVHTGLALYDREIMNFIAIKSDTAVAMEQMVLQLRDRLGHTSIRLLIEDSRGNYVRQKDRDDNRMRGVGSVWRDMQRWDEFCDHFDIHHTMQPLTVHNPFRLVKEGGVKRKFRHEEFVAITGWPKRTNEHERCAAGLVWRK